MMMKSYTQIKSEIETSRWYAARFGNDVRSDEQMTGAELYAYLSGRGLINDWRELTDVPVGGSLAIATTRYDRVS